MGLLKKIKLLFQKPLQIKNFTGQEIVIRSKNSGKIDLNRKLLVPENFICFLVAKETVCDKFTSGEHKLSIENLPILTRKLKLNVPSKKGKYKESFFADIYFVNLGTINDCNFKSEQGIYIKKDKQFLGLTCFVKGKYQFKIFEPYLFLESILKVYGIVNSGLAKRQISIWTGELVDKKIEKNKPTVEQINERDSSCFEGLAEYLNKNTRDIGIEYSFVEVTETIMPKKIYKRAKLDYTENTESSGKRLEPQLQQTQNYMPNAQIENGYNAQIENGENTQIENGYSNQIENDIENQLENGEAPTIMKQPTAIVSDGISFFEEIKDFDSSAQNIDIQSVENQMQENSEKQQEEFEQDNQQSLFKHEYDELNQNQDEEVEEQIEQPEQESLEEMQVKIAYKKCKYCGAINSKDSKSCFNCKKEFKKICQHCGEEITNGDFVCPRCKSVVI